MAKIMVANDLRVKTVSRAAVYGSLLHKSRISRRHFIAVQAFWLALLITFSTLLQVYLQAKPIIYKLDPKTYGLIGNSRDDAKDYLKQNKSQTSFDFVVPETTTTETNEHTGRVDDAYSANLATNAQEGISITDSQSNITVTMIPEFYTGDGQKVDGDHIVYPSGSKKLIYTLKYNGLKEDIIVPNFQGSDLAFKFKLRLPSGVEARMDGQGNVGVYSSDSTLFGNISFGSDEDRAKVDKARESGAKTSLVMTIPAPIVKDASGGEHTDRSVFKLGDKKVTETKDTRADLPADIPKSLVTTNEYLLTIESKNLKDLPYPISIDPTMIVASTSDFTNVNIEGGGEYDSTASPTLIKRQSLSGGSLGSFALEGGGAGTGNGDGLMLNDTLRNGSVVYNGYIYTVGGIDSASIQKVQWAHVDNEANGDIGAWSEATLNVKHEWNPGAIVYNGYLYVMGGMTSIGGVGTTAVEYAKIGANGVPGTWSTTTVLPKALGGLSAVALNGFVYIAGGCVDQGLFSQGCNSTADMSDDAYRAPINADGTFGSWTQSGMPSAGKLPKKLFAHRGAIWGDYYYLVGGRDTSSFTDTVYYAKINSDGTMGSSWLTTTSLPAQRSDFAMAISSGYVYVIAGSTGALQSDALYAQINADGSLGAWRTTGATLATGYMSITAVALKNGIATIGGDTSGSCGSGNVCKKVQYAAFKTAGSLHTGTWSTGGTLNFTNQVWGRAVAVYNGYMYATGGYDNSGGGAYQNRSEVAAINSTGATSGWARDASSDMVVARSYHTLHAYNGYLYAIGGCTGGVLFCSSTSNAFEYAPINADGTLGTWTQSSRVMSQGRSTHGGAVYNGYLYVLGGSGGVTSDTTTEYAQISPSGGDITVAGWQTGPTITGTQNTAATAYNGHLYLAGGGSGASPVAKVYESTLNSANGSMGAFSDANATDMTIARAAGFGLAAVKGYLYAWGSGTNATEFAPINTTTGVVGAWTQTQAQSIADDYSGYVTDGNALTTINRANGSTQYQVINNGGSGKLTGSGSGWTTATGTTTGTSARFGHATVAYNGYLYVAGGCGHFTVIFLPLCNTGSGSAERTDILRAAIGANGDLGNWAATTTG